MQLRTVFDPCIHKDLEEYIYQIDCCIPVTKCLIVLFSEVFSFGMVAVTGATAEKNSRSSISSAIMYFIFLGP